MSARLLKLILITLVLASTSSCAPVTYSKDKVIESIKKLCKEEYHLDVKVKIIGSTLGVFIPIEGLVDEKSGLDKKAGEKIEDVALSMHRVLMSTDKPLKIYALTARDTKTSGAEFVLTGFVYDIIRVRLLDISRGEYHKRILRDFRFNPIVAGETKIREFISLLNENSPLVKSMAPLIYPIYRIGRNSSQKIEIIEVISKEISEQEALFHIKTKEFYDPLPNFEAYKAIFPPGFNNEYLILVNISKFPNSITEIVSKYFYSGSELRQRNLENTFNKYKDVGYIGIDGFPKRELSGGWLLSIQIARRIKQIFLEEKRLKEKFTVQTSIGSIENKIFKFKFSITSPEDSEESKDTEIIFSRILKLAGWVLHRYDFEDFEGIELTDIAEGGKTVYLSKENLGKFRKNRLKITDLLKR